MEKTAEYEEETTYVVTIPTAEQMAHRIRDEVYLNGEEFRKNHPEMVARVAGLLNGIHRGRELFIENKRREFNIDEVTACLDGLGYEVKPAHPMVSNPFGAFRITWWPDNEPNPFLG